MSRLLPSCLVVVVAVLNSLAHAHFPFIVPDADGAAARVVMSETLDPYSGVSIDIIAGASFSLRSLDGRETPVTASKTENWLTLALPGSGTRIVSGKADLGIMKRGDVAHLLIYHPKTIIGDPFDHATVLGAKVPVELVPVRAAGGFKLKLLIAGAPANAMQVRLITSDGKETDLDTDSSGLTPLIEKTGRYAAWARHWVDESGTRAGKDYAQVRHYATLVFDYQAERPASLARAAPVITVRTPLPEPLASFGAVASDGWLYVYGGHITDRHDYSTASVSKRFRRLNLREANKWEELPGGVGVQGMNLAAWRGKIYRIGGMDSRNAPGEPADSHSTADAACFDPANGLWTSLPPLPQPRSSHDVIVMGDQLLVIGGWWMKGRANEAQWLDTIEVLDLSAAEPKWQSLPQPFQRRALIVAARDERIFVIGGFDSDEVPHLDVDIYDMRSKSWSKGPPIPGKQRNGFAPAACACNGSIYLSVSTGEMFRLSDDASAWQPFTAMTPRLAHRMVANDAEVLVIGGAAGSQMLDLVEAVSLSAATANVDE